MTATKATAAKKATAEQKAEQKARESLPAPGTVEGQSFPAPGVGPDSERVKPEDESDPKVISAPSALGPSIFLGSPKPRPTGELVDEDGNPTTLKASLKKDDPGYIARQAVYERFLPPGVLEGYETTLLLIPAGHRVTQEYVDSLQIGER